MPPGYISEEAPLMREHKPLRPAPGEIVKMRAWMYKHRITPIRGMSVSIHEGALYVRLSARDMQGGTYYEELCVLLGQNDWRQKMTRWLLRARTTLRANVKFSDEQHLARHDFLEAFTNPRLGEPWAD